MSSEILNENPIIFTTGAFLKPLKTITTEGNEIWVWCVTEFVDDSYLNGNCFNPEEFGNSIKALLVNTTSENE